MSKLRDLHQLINGSADTRKKKKYDHITYRVLFIRKLLEETALTPLIDLALQKVGSSNDVRVVLNKKTLNFSALMTDLHCKLMYIKSGSTGHTFRGILSAGEGLSPFNIAVKVVPYPKRESYGCMNDIRRPENVELLMLKVLSRFVLDNQTPHIVLPIATFNTNIKPFVQLGANNLVKHKRFLDFVDRYKKGDYFEHVSVLISEWANGGDLLDYLKANHENMKLLHWKVVFFQIISTLAIIHEDYPDFRLNDAKCNNILVHRIESHRSNRHKYLINGTKYVVPNIGIQVKIWDFDFACLPGLVKNSKVEAEWTNKINVKPTRNRYYDIHMFFNTLTRKGFLPQILTSEKIPQAVKDFIKRVVPDEYRDGAMVTEKGRVLVDTEYTTPAKLLKDPFFENFIEVASAS